MVRWRMSWSSFSLHGNAGMPSSQNPSRQATVQFIMSTIQPGMPHFGLIETHGNLVFRFNAFKSGIIAFKA